jgi:hypothetical protein
VPFQGRLASPLLNFLPHVPINPKLPYSGTTIGLAWRLPRPPYPLPGSTGGKITSGVGVGVVSTDVGVAACDVIDVLEAFQAG